MITFPVQTHDQRAVLGNAIAFAILAVIAVCLRLLAHQIAHKKWTASDWFIIAACIFSVGLQSISITGVIQAGIGYGHVAEIASTYGLEPITKLSKLIIPLQFLWVLSLSCTKISILFLYLRIFPVRWLVWSSWATITVIAAWAIATILAGCLVCRPFAFNWDKTIPGGKCGNQVTSFTVTGVINLVTDVVVLVLPMPSLSKLQMATYKKVTLIAVFGLGVVTCVISALRISVLSTMDFNDITYTIPRANIFSGIEPCLAVILASVPMMRPLLGRTRTTPHATGATPVYNSDERSKGHSQSKSLSKSPRKGSGTFEDGFERLDDDTSQLWLRPLGPKHSAGISVRQDTLQTVDGERDLDISGSEENLTDSGAGNGNGWGRGAERGIRVRQEWAVRESRGR
ncbi:putative integral membrane protein [Aspergillus undulatus]|uniref:putative integral membrane protein n=1 Tax=Aspergillus undulatus TaxID=1810928 RepID=UPI003CCE3E03